MSAISNKGTTPDETALGVSWEFDLFFRTTTLHCSQALSGINQELVLHNKINEHFGVMLEFLESISKNKRQQFSKWHWLGELAARLEEDFEKPFHLATNRQPYYDWLTQKIALLKAIREDPENENKRKESQLFLTAWFNLVSDYQIDPRR